MQTMKDKNLETENNDSEVKDLQVKIETLNHVIKIENNHQDLDPEKKVVAIS